MILRKEEPADSELIYQINTSAFETTAEARLVDALRKEAEPFLSLVAETTDGVVGHIAFSPVAVSGSDTKRILGLAPMAVKPEQQRQGIGGALINAGLQECRRISCGAVVVLGHADYYPKFGFQPSTIYGLRCEYDVPEEAFMALELEADYLKSVRGVVRYHSAFNMV